MADDSTLEPLRLSDSASAQIEAVAVQAVLMLIHAAVAAIENIVLDAQMKISQEIEQANMTQD